MSESKQEASTPELKRETQETTMPTPEQLENRFMSDVLRHVVCDCGNYRHHGVDWMPDGSGEGKKEALELMRNYFAKARLQDWVDGTSELRAALREKESELATAKQELDQSDRDCMYIKSVLVGEKVRNQALSRELERLRTEIKT
jgi:hypothetical protein